MGEAAHKPKPPISGRDLAAIAAHRYSSDLRAYLSLRLNSQQDVEDVAQAVFLKLVRIKNDNLIVEKPFGFLRLIAKRALAEFVASRARERAHVVSVDRIECLLPADSKDGTGEDLDMQRVETALSQLSPSLASALLLVARDGLSYAEAAERLGVSEHAVKKNIQRARAQLRRSLFREKDG